MRIGLVVYGDLDQRSGGYLYDRQLVAALRARGHTVIPLSLPRRPYPCRLTDNFGAALERQAHAARLAVLLQDELNHASLLWRNPRLRERLSCPLVGIVHHLRADEEDSGWRRAAIRALERRYLRTLDGYIFNSRTTRAAVQDLVGTTRPSVVACPAGDRFGPPLDPAAIAARAGRGGPLRVLFVGNLLRRKGLHTLLDALARLPACAWRLTVVGEPSADPAYTSTIRARIARLRLGAGVTLSGALDDAGLAACLAESDVLAVPSSLEGFGIVYLEGMAFGLPVLATTGGAAREIVTPGRDGYLIAPGDAAALAAHLARLHTDRALLARLSLAARARYLAQPSWSASMARAADFVERMGTAGWPSQPSTPSRATWRPSGRSTTAR